MPQIPKHIPIQMLFIVYAILKCPIPSMISYSSSTLYICNLKSSMHSPPHLLHHHLRFEVALLGHSVILCHSDMHPKSTYNCIQPSSLYSISSIAHDTPTCTAYFDTPTAHVRRFPHVIDIARDRG